MMTLQMDKNTTSSPRERAQSIFDKTVELEIKRRKAAQARNPFDPNLWQQIRENYEAIVLEDHTFSEEHNIEFTLWQLHYKRIEDFRSHISAVLASSNSSSVAQNSKGPSRPDRVANLKLQFRTFLSEATGFYHEMILKIRAKYGLPLGYFQDSQNLADKDGKKIAEVQKGLVSCHRCLIYLGDLARYKGLYGEGDSKNREHAAASSYYLQAASLLPGSGNPHHQLAIIASYSGDEFAATYRYFRSLAVETPFPTARDNLIVAFEKNRQSYAQLFTAPKAKDSSRRPTGKRRGKGGDISSKKDADVAAVPEKDKVTSADEMLKAFCVRFVRLNGILFTRTSLETFSDVLASTSSSLRDLISSSLKEEMIFGKDTSDSALFIVRLVTILIFSVDNSKKEKEGQSYAEIVNRVELARNSLIASFELLGHVIEQCAQLSDPSSRIESKEARISSLRSAMAETFPEPNRRLLQRILKMMHTISSHSHENRMNPSAVAACMAPLLLRPLLAGECDLEDEFDSGEDNSAQLLAAANAANNAQAIITVLLEDYGSIFDEENIQRCSVSTESHIGNSGPDDSSDDDNNSKNEYHNAENEVEPVTDDDDNERALSGKMSESSGDTSSDLYEYKGFVADDSDIESPGETSVPIRNSNVRTDHVVRNLFINSTDHQQAGEQIGGDDPTKYGGNSRLVNGGESFQPEKVLNVLTHGNTLISPGLESSSERPVNKGTPSSVPAKRATFWGRGSARKRSTDGSFDSSGEDEVAIQRLETTKNELRQRIAKEARGNAILQASLERRKQALHERRLSLEQDVSRLQEQLQAERDLRAALEVGLSMSSGQFSSHGVDSKTRFELEEIALAEADVARLKQKVAELHHQLSQQRQTNFGSFSEARDSHQYLQNHNPQKRFLQQDFDSTLAFVNHERKQRHEENVLGAEWRNSKGGGSFGVGSNSRQPSLKQVQESTSMVVDSKSSEEESGKMFIDKFSAIDSPSVPSTSRSLDITTEYARPNHPSAAASAALVELTTRLDFFKERRSQLMDQLHSLDLNYGPSSSSQDFIHRPPSSPPWN